MMLISSSTGETRMLGARLASQSTEGAVYALEGDLGSGKTEFVRGFVAHFSSGQFVRSPSFSIVNTYPTLPFPVFHFDFYRLTDASELFEIGFSEYLATPGICIIEWADMFPSILPPEAKRINFREHDGDKRELSFHFDMI